MTGDDKARIPTCLLGGPIGRVCGVGSVALLLCTMAVQALTMPLTAARTAQVAEPLASDSFAVGPFREDGSQLRRIEGNVTRTAWRIRGSDATTLQILSPLRQQLADKGYAILFECDTATCGGFDFRYSLAVISEPEMHVDLGDFRYLVAERAAAGGKDHVMILVSRSADSGFVQMTDVGPYDPNATTMSASTKSPEPVVETPPSDDSHRQDVAKASPDVAALLETDGQVALDDLVFQTGSTELGPGSFASLAATAAYLAAHPDRSITLVGHTDAVGSLNVNVAISKKRAQSVVDRLVSVYGVSASQLSAQGVGFLSPRATNLTDEGRTENRRVEAILTSTR